MAPEKSKFPSAADRYKIVNAIGADDLRKKELQERKERERDALLERLREERANPKPAVEAPAERPKQVYLAYKQNGGDADDGSRLTIKLTIPPAWLDKPCAKLARVRRRGPSRNRPTPSSQVKAFAKSYNANPKRDAIDPMAAHLAGADRGGKRARHAQLLSRPFPTRFG